MSAESRYSYRYVDLRFGERGNARYLYLLGLLGQGAIVALFVFWLLPVVVAEHPFSTGGVVMVLAFLCFLAIFLLHLRATLKARHLVQEAVVENDDLWVRCMFGRERRIRRHDVTGHRWIGGRDWFNFMDASYMDNAERSNIALEIADGSVLYIFNDGEQAPHLLEALTGASS